MSQDHLDYVVDHVAIQCADVGAAKQFYDAFFGPLGAGRVIDFDDEAVGYGVDGKPQFWIGRHHTGTGFRECHLAFAAADRQRVDEVFEAAVAAGAEVLHKPRVWPEYHPSYYAAFLRDPDGNNVEVVTHRPE